LTDLKKLQEEKPTMAKKIDGEKIAEKLLQELEERPISGTPRLEIIYTGENPASEVFIQRKKEAGERLNFEVNVTEFTADPEQEELIEKIEEFNQDKNIDGILVQLPLQSQINNDTIFEALSPEKDVDCLTPENLGKLLRGNPWIKPCAVEGIEEILDREEIVIEGKNIVIVNNSNLIGKPLSMNLTQKNATLTLCHRRTENLEEHTRHADIIITATGESELITEDMISEGTTVIDAGYSYTDGELTHEVEKSEEISYLSSVPRGLGPVTVAVTMKNLLRCFKR